MAQSIKLGDDIFLAASGIDGLVKSLIPSTANLDDYKTYHHSGTYYIGDSSSMQNAPMSWAFLTVYVYGAVIIQQVVGLGHEIWLRTSSDTGATWTTWKRFYTKAYEDITITTGSTLYNEMYYGDATPTNARKSNCNSLVVIDVQNSRPAYITWASNASLRAFTTTANTAVSVRVWYTP